jgi:hypothetical protein
MGAGRSIAVQNFNEQACILGLGAITSVLAMLRLSVFITITILGVIVALAMWAIKRQHARNCARYPDEIARLLAVARSDNR